MPGGDGLAGWGLLWAAGFAAVFAVFWSAVCVTLAAWGGWRALARHYAGEVRAVKAHWRFQSATMRRMTNYNFVLSVTVGEDGLGLSVLGLFRPGHPHLKVPWDDLSAEADRHMLLPAVKLSFRRVPGVFVRISPTLAERIGRARGEDLLES